MHFIGYLCQQRMLTETIMHECTKMLLADVASPKQQDLGCLVRLMSTVDRQLDAKSDAKGHMDAYFQRIDTLCKNQALDSRSWSMLQASIFLYC